MSFIHAANEMNSGFQHLQQVNVRTSDTPQTYAANKCIEFMLYINKYTERRYPFMEQVNDCIEFRIPIYAALTSK